ncbi:MAG: hypothetical protein H3C35_03265 [Bacteroidetes bacterium]|nr:hypothetical protein [Bacteroidota bacterium]
MKKSSLLIVVFSLLLFSFTFSQTVQKAKTPRGGRVIGTIFNHAEYYLNEPTAANPSVATGGRSQFEFTRANIGYEYYFNQNLYTRVMYEAAGNYLQEGYLRINNIFPQNALTFGLMKTEASKMPEKIWEYRALDKMILDRNGFTQGYDKGIELSSTSSSFYYNLMAGNGSGVFGENNKLKKLYLSFGSWLDKNNVLDFYVDYENVATGKSSLTGKFFYGMTSQTFALGVEAFYRIDKKFAIEKVLRDRTPLGGSVFSWVEFTKGMRGVLRVDFVDDDFNNSNPKVTLPISNASYREASYRHLYLNVGVDFAPIPEVHIIPNIVYDKSMKKGNSPLVKDTQIVRLTAAVYFPTRY